MRILVSIDDTDDLESRGTGEIADLIADGIAAHGWGSCGAVTRHQLLLHPDIAYTSHNSSMCFPADIPEELLDTVRIYCSATLTAESVPAADPGLCILAPQRLTLPQAIIDFGYRAKTNVLTKDEAYRTAVAHGVHLSEHGGTGLGVIGALAGAGLRLSGNDGRFKGKFRVPARNGVATVAEIRAGGIDLVQQLGGGELDDGEEVLVGEWVKPVLKDNRVLLLVTAADDGLGAPWKACDRKIFKDF